MVRTNRPEVHIAPHILERFRTVRERCNVDGVTNGVKNAVPKNGLRFQGVRMMPRDALQQDLQQRLSDTEASAEQIQPGLFAPPPNPTQMILEDDAGQSYVLAMEGGLPVVVPIDPETDHEWDPAKPENGGTVTPAQLEELAGQGEGAAQNYGPLSAQQLQNAVHEAGASRSSGGIDVSDAAKSIGRSIAQSSFSSLLAGNLSAGGLGMAGIQSAVGFGLSQLTGQLMSGWSVSDDDSTAEQLAHKYANELIGVVQGELMNQAASALGLAGAGGSATIADRITEFFEGVPSSASVPVARLGTTNQAKGLVLKGAPTVLITNLQAARQGDETSMVNPGPDAGPITTGNPTILVEGVPLAGDFHVAVGTGQGVVTTLTLGEPTVLMGSTGITPVTLSSPDAADQQTAQDVGSGAGGQLQQEQSSPGGGNQEQSREPQEQEAGTGPDTDSDREFPDADTEKEILRQAAIQVGKGVAQAGLEREVGEATMRGNARQVWMETLERQYRDAIAKYPEGSPYREAAAHRFQQFRSEIMQADEDILRARIEYGARMDAVDRLGAAFGFLGAVDKLVEGNREIEQLVAQGRHQEAVRHMFGTAAQATFDGLAAIPNRFGMLTNLGIGTIGSEGAYRAGSQVGEWVEEPLLDYGNRVAWWLHDHGLAPGGRSPRFPRPED